MQNRLSFSNTFNALGKNLIKYDQEFFHLRWFENMTKFIAASFVVRVHSYIPKLDAPLHLTRPE